MTFSDCVSEPPTPQRTPVSAAGNRTRACPDIVEGAPRCCWMRPSAARSLAAEWLMFGSNDDGDGGVCSFLQLTAARSSAFSVATSSMSSSHSTHCARQAHVMAYSLSQMTTAAVRSQWWQARQAGRQEEPCQRRCAAALSVRQRSQQRSTFSIAEGEWQEVRAGLEAGRY
jgi:hypothetical protein